MSFSLTVPYWFGLIRTDGDTGAGLGLGLCGKNGRHYSVLITY
jgi:hypothetical protein